jgi:hypothetical protein
MIVVLCGSSGLSLRGNDVLNLGRPLQAFGEKQRIRCFVPTKTQQRVAYPTPPVPDNMSGEA